MANSAVLTAEDAEESAVRQEAESLCEQAGSAYSLFRDPTGSVDVNLQTAEVFLCVYVCVLRLRFAFAFSLGLSDGPRSAAACCGVWCCFVASCAVGGCCC